jgi:hypothetical protein
VGKLRKRRKAANGAERLRKEASKLLIKQGAEILDCLLNAPSDELLRSVQFFYELAEETVEPADDLRSGRSFVMELAAEPIWQPPELNGMGIAAELAVPGG